MVLTRCTPEGGSLGGANAQGEHFVAPIRELSCLRSVSIVFHCQRKWFPREVRPWTVVWAQHWTSAAPTCSSPGSAVQNTPFSRLYTLVTRQRRVRHRSADPLRRAGLKPRPFVPRITCNGAPQVLHWNRDQQYSQYAAHAGPSFDGAHCDGKACSQSCDPNIDNAERPIALTLNQRAVELCINLLETDLKVVFPFGFR